MSSWAGWPCSWSTSSCGASPGCARPGTRSRRIWRCCEAPRKRPSRRQSRPGDPMVGNGGSPIYVDGPWSHRPVTANGTRFHIAENGEGPLVLLLHGFPQFWWTWRSQLPSLSAAGFRAVAADLRGYGGSDKPPRGYDLITAASDAAGMVRALGEANAVVVGHDWGGLVAWTMAAYYPKVVRRLAVVSVAHPLRMRAEMFAGPLRRGWRNGSTLGFQLPVLPESRLARRHAEQVGRMLRAWSGPGWPDQETEGRYRAAMAIPLVAHSALEYHRWFVRSWLRTDGIRYAHRMRTPIGVPTLHLHGAMDPCVPTRSAQASARYVDGPYRWRLIEGAGHFLPEEQPDKFDSALHNWLADPEPER